MFSIVIQSKWKYFCLVLRTCLRVLLITGSALIYGELVNSVSRGIELKSLLINISLTLLYTICTGLFTWYNIVQFDYFTSKSVQLAQNAYMNKILGAKYSLISNSDSSKYISNVTNDIKNVSDTLIYGSVYTISNLTMVVSSFVAACILSWKIALSMLAFTVLMAILPFFIKKPLDKSSIVLSRQNQSFIGVLKEYLLGISIVKSYSAEEQSMAKIHDESELLYKTRKKFCFINGAAGGLGVLVREISVVGLIGLTCYFVYTKDVGIGAVLSIFSIGSQFYSGFLGISANVTSLAGIRGVKKMLDKVFNMENSPAPVNQIQFKSNIVLKDVNFTYANDTRSILNNINLTFEKNKKYLILGKSGSGKSTLLKILAKYYDGFNGSITLDGKDYNEYTEKEITGLIATSQQNCYLFNRSLKDNIDFLGEGNYEKLQAVISLTALNEFVNLLLDGVDTIIDEEVNQVSGGEKLRINLARALYRSSEILLLDEVTSALDKKTAEFVENNLLSINDKTVINVCHKFNDKTLGSYDKIFIIESGTIVRNGSYADLQNDDLLKTYRNVE